MGARHHRFPGPSASSSAPIGPHRPSQLRAASGPGLTPPPRPSLLPEATPTRPPLLGQHPGRAYDGPRCTPAPPAQGRGRVPCSAAAPGHHVAGRPARAAAPARAPAPTADASGAVTAPKESRARDAAGSSLRGLAAAQTAGRRPPRYPCRTAAASGQRRRRRQCGTAPPTREATAARRPLGPPMAEAPAGGGGPAAGRFRA